MENPFIFKHTYQFLLSLLAAGGGAAIAYGLFKILAENWIASAFERQLENYKMQLNALFNRIVKNT